MEDHKVTPLWDGNAEEPERPLRRPNNRTNVSNSVNSTNVDNLQDSLPSLDLSVSFNDSVSLNDDDDILSKSNLSVDAKEWFPPNYNKNITSDSSNTKSVQNRLLKFKTQPEAPVNNFSNGEESILPSDFVLDEPTKDISKLQVIICTLIEDPGQYDDLIGTFIETLGPYYEEVNIVSTTTNLIFSQAITEPNFRYNAARLCNTIQEQCPLFRSALHLLCEQKIKENSYDANLALFLAELYSQLNYDNLYGRHVIHTLKNVLSLGTETDVKSVCQVLKLTGASLESYNKQAINDIFNQLDVVKQYLSNSVVNLINSVVTLRASNWGQGQSSPVNTNRFQSNESHPLHDEPIFYGPDGKELTDEERQFLTDNCSYQADFLTDDSDPDGLWDPDPEMDEEMQAAFRQFVQLSK